MKGLLLARRLFCLTLVLPQIPFHAAIISQYSITTHPIIILSQTGQRAIVIKFYHKRLACIFLSSLLPEFLTAHIHEGALNLRWIPLF
jgi:hypothetical protein